METFVQLIASGLGWMLLVAALTKFDSWGAWESFSTTVFGDGALSMLVRLGIPAAEATSGVVILLAPSPGLAVSTLLLVVFTVGVGVLARSHRGLKCNCFGVSSSSSIGKRLVVRNAGLAGLSGVTLWGATARGVTSGTVPTLISGLLVVVAVALLVEMTSLRRTARHQEVEIAR